MLVTFDMNNDNVYLARCIDPKQPRSTSTVKP